ncbi:MAG: metallophosphoesterase family protein [Chloroflexi bacterium]|nr:metallophosphoesterase family protein [Chloroflexota bacterium]
MRCLIISDIHSNLPALEAVLADVQAFDEVWCLGDLVGYGPYPNECIERIRNLPHMCIIGNHDQAALGRIDMATFNLDARLANVWTQQQLTSDSCEFLAALPQSIERDGFHLVHGSPRDPIWEYVIEPYVACANFRYSSAVTCLVGHSHLPLLFTLVDHRDHCDARLWSPGDVIQLGRKRIIINPGSVGQPRDGDPRASYAILDTSDMSWRCQRVDYPIEVVQDRMRAEHLSRRLIDRLAIGR